MAMHGLYIAKDAPWRTDLISEMMSFPVGVHDDQVDALGLVGQLIDKMIDGRIPKPKPEKPKHLVYEVQPDGRVVGNMSVRERVMQIEKKRKRDEDR
jgi:hypothetical protein